MIARPRALVVMTVTAVLALGSVPGPMRAAPANDPAVSQINVKFDDLPLKKILSTKMREVADPATQARFRGYRDIIVAARQMGARGLLHPDTDASQYLDAVKQWSLWTRIERWNAPQFERAFVERTRKNLEELKQPWTRQTEGVVGRAERGVFPDIPVGRIDAGVL